MSPNPSGILGDFQTSDHTEEIEGQVINYDEYCGDDVEYFNSDFVEVDRIISCDRVSVPHSFLQGGSSSSKGRKKLVDRAAESEFDSVLYLVKWMGQPYCQSTWEKWANLKNCQVEVKKFWENQIPPSADMLEVEHPNISQYTKLDESPIYGIDTESIIPSEIQLENGLQLRDYQLEGVNWLLWNWWLHRPCILADEMGLGKTIQTIAFLHQLRVMEATKVRGPFIVVGPLSLVDQWQTEINTWSPQMNCIVYHGSTEARELIQQHEFYFSEPFVSKATSQNLRKANVCKFNILLTTYEIAIKDIRILSRINWEVHQEDSTRLFQISNSQISRCFFCGLFTFLFSYFKKNNK